jgi:hypothetical protein
LTYVSSTSQVVPTGCLYRRISSESAVQHPRADGRGTFAERLHSLHPTQALTQVSTNSPEPRQRTSQAMAKLAVASGFRPGQCSPHIVVFALQPTQPEPPVRTAQRIVRDSTSGHEQAQCVVQSIGDLVHGEHGHPCGRQLDRERNSIQATADVTD